MRTVIFTCHCWLSTFSWWCLMANSRRLICEITPQQISLHLLLSVQVISQWQSKARKHKSHNLSCRCDLNLQRFPLTMPFSFLPTRLRTYTLLTHWHPYADGFSYMAAWGRSIGFKNTHNICKALWLIILVLQCNHAIWAWAVPEHEPYGKGGDDEASMILMKWAVRPRAGAQAKELIWHNHF